MRELNLQASSWPLAPSSRPSALGLTYSWNKLNASQGFWETDCQHRCATAPGTKGDSRASRSLWQTLHSLLSSAADLAATFPHRNFHGILCSGLRTGSARCQEGSKDPPPPKPGRFPPPHTLTTAGQARAEWNGCGLGDQTRGNPEIFLPFGSGSLLLPPKSELLFGLPTFIQTSSEKLYKTQ